MPPSSVPSSYLKAGFALGPSICPCGQRAIAALAARCDHGNSSLFIAANEPLAIPASKRTKARLRKIFIWTPEIPGPTFHSGPVRVAGRNKERAVARSFLRHEYAAVPGGQLSRRLQFFKYSDAAG